MTKTSPFFQFPVSGPEVWTIAGNNYDIESTYLIVLPDLPDGTAQYTINYLCQTDVDPTSLSQERALELALPLMIYAYDQGLYQSAQVHKLGRKGKPLSISRIGVAIIQKNAVGTKGLVYAHHSGGYRVALTLDENRAHEDTAKPAPPESSTGK
jgi:hypothetical protein